ncbi:MAG: hydrogenase 3 maturation endopeptidase HyCI [candidate division WOR-3 bacterium]
MGKILIVGVGNRLRCDDGVGSHIVDLFKERVKDVEVIDAGTVPENYLESITQKRPQRVLIVDACLFDGKPGEFRLFDLESFENLHFPNFSTHTLPLNLIAQLIITKTNAKVYLLGIQPAQRGFGEKLSPVLSATLPKILNYIEEWILAPI